MRSFPAAGWIVTHVHVEDWAHPSLARPARVLLSRERTQGFVLPVRADAHQLFGAVLADAEPGEWHPLDPRLQWRPGRLAVVKAPGHVEFVTHEMLERHRTQEADRLIRTALTSNASIETSEGLLEMADGLLGGHVVPLAAEMYLLRGDPSRAARLRTRFLRVAPSGPAALEPRLLQFPTFQAHRALADAVRAATSETLREPIEAAAWAQVRDETLARWWLSSTMARDQMTITEVARMLGVAGPTLRSLIRKGSGLSALPGLPPRDQMFTYLAELGGELSPDVEAALADAHRPRFALFARQLAALERLTGNSDRLARWKDAASLIAEQRDRMRGLNDASPWQRAQQGSEELHSALLGLGLRSPATTMQFVDRFGAALAGAALGAPNLVCASSFALETGPLIALAPRMGIGAARFAIAHQLGHLLDPDADGADQPCALAGSDLDRRWGPHEKFANAFAVYLLAPRSAVLAQIGGADVRRPEVLFDATADVAMVFGLSAGAALRHALNCAGVSGADFEDSLRRALEHSDWRQRREDIDDEVEGSWAADRSFIHEEIGELPGWSVEAALRRPSATRFTSLAKRAASAGLIERSEAEALLAS